MFINIFQWVSIVLLLVVCDLCIVLFTVCYVVTRCLLVSLGLCHFIYTTHTNTVLFSFATDHVATHDTPAFQVEMTTSNNKNKKYSLGVDLNMFQKATVESQNTPVVTSSKMKKHATVHTHSKKAVEILKDKVITKHTAIKTQGLDPNSIINAVVPEIMKNIDFTHDSNCITMTAKRENLLASFCGNMYHTDTSDNYGEVMMSDKNQNITISASLQDITTNHTLVSFYESFQSNQTAMYFNITNNEGLYVEQLLERGNQYSNVMNFDLFGLHFDHNFGAVHELPTEFNTERWNLYTENYLTQDGYVLIGYDTYVQLDDVFGKLGTMATPSVTIGADLGVMNEQHVLTLQFDFSLPYYASSDYFTTTNTDGAVLNLLLGTHGPDMSNLYKIIDFENQASVTLNKYVGSGDTYLAGYLKVDNGQLTLFDTLLYSAGHSVTNAMINTYSVTNMDDGYFDTSVTVTLSNGNNQGVQFDSSTMVNIYGSNGNETSIEAGSWLNVLGNSMFNAQTIIDLMNHNGTSTDYNMEAEDLTSEYLMTSTGTIDMNNPMNSLNAMTFTLAHTAGLMPFFDFGPPQPSSRPSVAPTRYPVTAPPKPSQAPVCTPSEAPVAAKPTQAPVNVPSQAPTLSQSPVTRTPTQMSVTNFPTVAPTAAPAPVKMDVSCRLCFISRVIVACFTLTYVLLYYFHHNRSRCLSMASSSAD